MADSRDSGVPNLLRRSVWDKVEYETASSMLEFFGEAINYLTADGAILTQISLPAPLAMNKRQMSPIYQNGGQNGSANT